MSSRMSPLSEEDLFYVRFWYASTVIGKDALETVLLAYTQGKISTTFKDALLLYYALKPNKKTPEGLYKQYFNNEERKKLEDPSISPKVFDITLSHKLLRRLHSITGLADHNDTVWTKDEPLGSNTSIEFKIFKVKGYRNDACHEICDLSESELVAKLDELELLYTKLVESVLNEKGETPESICKKTDDIKKRFADLRNPIHEVITDKDIEVYLIEKRDVLKILQNKTKQSCQLYLRKLYEDTYEHNPIEWLDLPQTVDTEEVFTDIVITEEEIDMSKKDKNNLNDITERKCDYREILTIKTKKLKTPKILTITAIGGNGKTTFTRLFVCKWGKTQSSILGLKDIDILLYVELRSVNESSCDEFLRNRLGNVMADIGLSFQKLKHILLTLNVLFILDGQDESPQNDLLKDILALASTQNKIKVIITTRPSASIPLQKIINGFKIPKIDLKILGIAKENQLIFIKKIVTAMVNDADRLNEILESVNRELPDLNDSMGELMQSPLMLTLLALLWIYGEIPEAVTLTELFMNVNKLLKGKLQFKLLLKTRTLSDVSLREKIDEFEEILQEIAFDTFARMEYNFKDSTIADLKNKLNNQCKLGEFESEILGHFLAPRKSRRNLELVIYYSYKHLRMHEYDASKYVCHVLSTGNDEEKSVIINQLKGERFSNIRAHSIAILTNSNPQLLKKYAKTIIDYEENGHNVDGYLRIISESKSNNVVMEMVATRMAQEPLWKITNPSALASLVSVMQSSQPRSLHLSFRNQALLPTFLASCLRAIADYDLELWLEFPVAPKSSRTEEAHNDYLLALTHPDSQAKLVEFRGSLSGPALQQLPSSLWVLEATVSSGELPILWHRIPHLSELQELCESAIFFN
ncbi:unnamed protein product [Meganyctiphanes norvegica]|uniref:NACHT domain-containing protein n=1 Tax=Meganyctiphanes norvegica TaxID=48144 RepID=A0AAV2RX26_MEGNR